MFFRSVYVFIQYQFSKKSVEHFFLCFYFICNKCAVFLKLNHNLFAFLFYRVESTPGYHYGLFNFCCGTFETTAIANQKKKKKMFF
jgi:hypothetical protein